MDAEQWTKWRRDVVERLVKHFDLLKTADDNEAFAVGLLRLVRTALAQLGTGHCFGFTTKHWRESNGADIVRVVRQVHAALNPKKPEAVEQEPGPYVHVTIGIKDGKVYLVASTPQGAPHSAEREAVKASGGILGSRDFFLEMQRRSKPGIAYGVYTVKVLLSEVGVLLNQKSDEEL